ncbi:MAG TPA: prephenate dehydrogenase/arogenate dehydrogenase family protein, partial [Chthoniobacterales bacterium]
MSTPVPYREIAILGPGLLGASLALALKDRACVRLWGRRPESIAEAEERGIAPCCTTMLSEAVSGADLVIFATPVEVMGGIARDLLPFLSPGAAVTDVGSVKGPVVAELQPIFGAHRFLGSHPMAGSEQSGSSAARADLFTGAACILTPTKQTPPSLLEDITALWQSLNCEVHLLTPELHDRRIALISHLPHLLAACLVNTVADADPAAFPLSGQG